MSVLAAISAQAVASKILSHLGLPTTLQRPAPARAPPWIDDELELEADVELELDVDEEIDTGQDLDVDLDLDDLPVP